MHVTVVRQARTEDGAQRRDQYDIPVTEATSISTALQYIARHFDGSLGYYLSCRRGMCACCVVRANGKIETACMVPIEDGMVIEPIRGDLQVQDTVVNLSMARDHQFDLKKNASS